MPQLREDVRTYVAHGDNVWGNSITHRSIGEHEISVTGWLSRAPFPRTGDKILVKMESDKWGWWVFGDVERASSVNDMFMARAYGAFGYAEGDAEPKTTSCDEFIEFSGIMADLV